MSGEKWRWLVLASFMAAGAVVFLSARIAPAGVVRSPHDFSATKQTSYTHDNAALAPGGVCSACHVAHDARDTVLWRRPLGDTGTLNSYRGRLTLRDGTPTGEPNFLLSNTLLCIDCHDNHASTDFESPSTPALAAFDDAHEPHNILSGFTKTGLGSMTEDGFGGSVAGYYENNPPGPSGNYGVTDPPPATARTGGHFFLQDPRTGAGGDAFDNGDKLPCRDCHDPHAWDPAGNWQAFFRKFWPAGSSVPVNLGSTVQASAVMANAPPSGGSRSNANSRKLCTACHGYAIPSSQQPVFFYEINASYTTNARIARPPDTVGEHADSSQVACVACHGHNAVSASCSSCHGFPPSDTSSPKYPSTFTPSPLPGTNLDSHARHGGARQDEAPNSFSVYSFGCRVCHFGSATGVNPALGHHQDDNVSVVLTGEYTRTGTAGQQDNTIYYNRDASFPPSITGQLDNTNNVAAGGWGNGSRYGGNRCRNVYCHSAGRAIPSMTSDNDYRLPQWNAGTLRCNGCHGTTTPDNALRTGMPDYANGGPGPTANSHAAHVVTNGYGCGVCHAGTTSEAGYPTGRSILSTTPTRHVNLLRDVQMSGVGGSAAYDNVNKRCSNVTCHGAGTPQWGETLPGCSACHLSNNPDSDHYLTPTDNLYAAGVAGNIDNVEWSFSGHGKTSGTYNVSGNPAANLMQGGSGGGDPCYYCHDPYVGHRVQTNPFRLKVQTGAASYLGSKGWNATCLVCHFHSTTPTADQPVGYDPDNSATVYTLQLADNAFVDNAHGGVEHSSSVNGGTFCWDCHDPHGDRPSAGVNNIYMIQGGTSRTGTAVGTLLRQSDNVYGFRGASGTLTTNAPIFTAATTGTDYADSSSPMQGICQVCHTQATTGHYRETLFDGHNQSTRCTQCHLHNGAFSGTGGPDIEQYFDRGYNNPASSGGDWNYFDNSSHPLTNTTSAAGLTFPSPMENCLSCHGAVYKSGGTAHYSNECIKCHFEHNGGASLGTNHLNTVVELSVPSETIPAARFNIASITDYDNWCLQCHNSGSVTLGGILPSSARRTVINGTDFADGRHRAVVPPDGPVGCIYCHQPHGRGNARIVRENPVNRRNAGPTPRRFGVYPNDNLTLGVHGTAQNIPYRARFDNVLPNVFADAADDHNFCNNACHDTTPSRRKDKVIRRDDNITGNYTLFPGNNKKIYIVNGLEYTNDNVNQTWIHGHVNNEIITTDDMVTAYAALIGLTGPGFKKYPGTGDANPAGFNDNLSPLPFFPDFVDGSRDFTNGYNNDGHIRYRYSCSTCHNPHGTSLSNTPGFNGYPDLRLERRDPSNLCNACHK